MPSSSTFSNNALSSPPPPPIIIINRSQSDDNAATASLAAPGVEDEEIPDEVAQAIAMIECGPPAAAGAAVVPFSNITNTIVESPPACYSRLCGLIRHGQGSRQKISLRQHSIADFDESEMYNLRDPTPLFQGNMLNVLGGWSILLDGESKIQALRSRFRQPNGPLAFQIEDTEMPRVLWHITERMMKNAKLRAHFPTAIPFIYDDRFNIINCIDRMKCFDSDRQEIINFHITDDAYYGARLWLEIYGVFVYQPENQANLLVAKLKVKVGQAQLFTRMARDADGAGNMNLRRTFEEVCQFDD